MNRDILDRWCERSILGLVLAIMVFGPLATGAVRPLDFLIIQGLTVGVLALWLLRFWLNPAPRLLWPPICWAVILFTAYAIGRYLTADIEYVGRHELIRVIIYAFLFFAILNNLHRQESTQIISFTMIFLAMGISFYAIYQFLTGSDRVWHFITPYKGRGSGTYICPNHLAGLLELLLPLALANVLVGRAKPLMKVFLGYAALVMVAGIGVTVSRGSWVACGLALLVFFGILAGQHHHRLPSLLLMLVLVVGCGYFIMKTESFKSRFREGLAEGTVERDARFRVWEATVRMWRDHVWFGVGPGHFDYRFRAYRPQDVQLRPDRAHNEYLNVLADWGVAGAAIVMTALGVLLGGLLKSWKSVRRSGSEFATNLSNKFAFVLGSSMGLLALLLHSCVDFNMQIPANAILAVSLMALLSSHLRFATERFWIGARLRLKMLASVVLLAGVVYLGYQELRLGHEYVWLQRASPKYVEFFSPWKDAVLKPPFAGDPTNSGTPYAIVALKKAFAAEPKNFETTYAIGEAYRMQSFEGGTDYLPLAKEAMEWFARGTKLNRFDGYNYMRYGMCLDWLDRHDEAGPYFSQADELDPNGYFTAAHVGWHYVQIDDYVVAKSWFERSLKLQWKDNDIAASYLSIVNARLLETALGQGGLRRR